MSGVREVTRGPADRRLHVLVVVFVLGLTAYFYNGYGWNQTARYDAIWSFVEPGPNQHTVRIDGFLTDPAGGFNTGDWARNAAEGPHYYANKAPGTTFLGIPFYFVLFHAERGVGIDPLSVRAVLVNAYLINLWVTVLPVALSAAFFLSAALALAKDARRALLLTLVLYAGTLMLPFSTMLWGHTTAAAFTVMALACFVAPGRWRMFWSGLFVGLATLTDYGAAPLAVLLAVATLASRERRPYLAALVLGGLGPALAFGVYHAVLFGSPLSLASSFSDPTMLSRGDVGGLFGGVHPRVIGELALSTSRGVFVYMPVLLLTVVAAVELRRKDPARRWLGAVLLANVVLVYALNASFNGWQGGISTGPRYEIVALPCWVLLLALLPEEGWVKVGLVGLGAVSFANMFVAAAVSPLAPDAYKGSALFFVYSHLARALGGSAPAPGAPLSAGSIHLYPQFPMRDWPAQLVAPFRATWTSFNLGERLFGLRGGWSLLPVLLFAAVMVVWMVRVADRRAPGERQEPAAS